MTETIIVHGKAGGVDDRGYPIPADPDRPVVVKSVQPLSLDELSAMGRDGTVDVLRVWAPAGTPIAPDDEVTVRGKRYRVEVNSWDWSRNRHPVLSRHRPSVVFDCVRGTG